MPKISELSPVAVPLLDDDQIAVVQETTGQAPIQPKLRRMSWSVLRGQIQPHIDAKVDATFIGTQAYADDRAVAALAASTTYTDTTAADLRATLAPKASPSFTGNATIAADLVVGGNLLVSGSTVSTNTETLIVDDPLLTLGGTNPPTVNDGKDRGVEYRWHDGTTARLGFFGFKRSTGRMTFIPEGTNSGEIFSGTVGTIEANLLGNVIGNVSGTAGGVSGIVQVGNGGTGAGTAAAARTNLGAAPLDSPNFTGSPQANGAALWTSGNDGAGSGLDADLLDSQDGAYYLALENATGTLPVAQGGTGATSAATARTNLGLGTAATQASTAFAAAVHTHGVTSLTATGTRDATTFLRGDNTWATPAGGGGSTLDSLSDVVITSPANGHAIRHNGTQWVNLAFSVSLAEIAATGSRTASTFLRGDGTWASVQTGSVALDDLSDVVVSAPSTGHTIRYSGSDWRNAALGVGDITGAAPAASPVFTGQVTLPTGTTAAGPLRFVSGSLRTTAAIGEIEFSAGALYFSTANSTRKTVAFTDSNITGSAANVTGTVAVANGGTGATSAANARTNLGAAPVASPAFSGRVRVEEQALTDGSLIATNASLANVYTVTLGGNRTLSNPTNLASGTHWLYRIKQDATGARTLAYGTAFKFPGGAAPALSTAANAVDILSCHTDGTNVYAVLTKDFR